MRKINRKQVWIWIATALILIALTLTPVWMLSRVGENHSVLTEEDVFLSEEKGYFRVLVAGTDRVSGLSDVLMLVSLNLDTDEAWILQLPRDTYAIYHEGSYRKLNGAPNFLGGMEQMKQMMSRALGVPIDRYVRLSPDAFCEAVDALGGVEIELERAMHYDDPAQGLSIHLKAGKQMLDGKAAEQFVRYRSGYAQGDLGRMDAQKVFLAALFRQIRHSASPLSLAKLGVSVLADWETNLTASDAMSLASEVLSLDSERVHFVTAPGESATAKSGASYYALSRQGMAELLETYFGGDAACFDPDRMFLNPNNEAFGSIYEGYSPYQIISAAES